MVEKNLSVGEGYTKWVGEPSRHPPGFLLHTPVLTSIHWLNLEFTLYQRVSVHTDCISNRYYTFIHKKCLGQDTKLRLVVRLQF